ncbi:MAG: glycosyltransferase family 2 protein [Bacteroidetes bacterium]|nr:glycosyltransferase family 2 protein [Bacteroidota bacterium]
MECKKLSIIMPAYNEELTIEAILRLIRDVELINDIQKEIIIVNDFSSDGTAAVATHFISKNPQLDIRIFHQEKNMGKGAALHTGIEHASGDLLIIQDADLEYDPVEYNEMIKPFLRGSADVVYGSRFRGGKPVRNLFYWHSIGNKWLTNLSNMMNNLNLTDMETCYKMFKTSIIKSIKLQEKRFGFEPEVTAKVARIPGIRIYEVGIAYYGRTYDEGKKINWKDGIRTIYCILKYSLFHRRPKF